MEINITRFFNESAPMDYSASVAEIGNNAGQDTWRAACEDADDYGPMLDTADKLDAMRAWANSSGGWDDEEIAAWSDNELNALFIQLVSGDIRECLEWDVPDVWANYQELAEAGTVSSNLFRTDDGQIYFCLGE
jgi:hypothetical protein